ncbi:hypothetical protein JHD49_10900 [Sulfurimonas sp. SAG-AH-194-C21]|nr:hypothetical protein [Sulfurimonas sp. SAG-AH-194-C21]MDF1884450.1 hypothetical protein [Sulfurimonas sp. SAG-AH-194-C21]
MKKLLILIATLSVVAFSGCSSSSVGPSAKTGLEGTKVNTYLVGEYMSVNDAEAKLKSAGFEIVTNYKSIKKGTTIVFTDAALKAEAAKPNRSNIAVMRLFVDEQEKMISITNPVYFGKAFMQEEYNHVVFNGELEKITKAFSGLKASKDEWDFDGLAEYHFMISMPYYKEVDVVGEGTNEALLAKAKSYKKGKGLIFELKLSDTTTLVGYALSKRTSKFVKKIGRANAGILPYCFTIDNGKVTALSAKYYIAISYPLLDMNGFMGIMTIPGAVIKDYEKVFK